jgi:hypothetical protein
MRPLVIDDVAKARVAEVESFAFANWYRPGMSENTPGDDSRHVAQLNTYRCVFSYTLKGDELFRHLSISIPGKKFPHPYAVFTIAELFGFTVWDGKSVKPPEDWMVAVNKTDHCVVAAQKVPDPQAQNWAKED